MRGTDARDFHDFVVGGAPRLMRLARMLSADPQAGEDLLQATLLKVWSAWPRIQRTDNPDAYIRRVMVNLATKNRLRRWGGEVPTADLPETAGRDEHALVDDRHELIQAVRQLPARQRAAVVLRYFDDLDDAAIADALACSVATVRSQISRALATMRVARIDEATPAKESS